MGCMNRLMIAAVLAGLSAHAVAQQAYPSKPIRLIVPYPPAAAADLQARAMSQKISEAWGQPIVIDNRAGANGSIAMEYVAKSQPDGYTLVYALTAQFVINPNLYPKIPYNPVKDYAPIALMVSQPYILLAHPSVPATNMKELIAYAKAQPGKLTNSAAGLGSTGYLCLEMLKAMTGTDILNVPYKGAAPALIDLLSGQAQLSFLAWSTAGSHVKTGRLRALAVTTAKRAPAIPDIPTIGETVQGYDMSVWYGLAAPAGTPKAIVNKLNAEFKRVLDSPEMRRDFEKDAMAPIGSTPEQFGSFIKTEMVKWAKLVKDSGAKVQ